MLCPSCSGFRPANNALCPLCNAPSPLVNEAWNGQNASFSGEQSQASFAPSWGGSGATQNNWSGSSGPQMAFPSAPQPNFGASDVQQTAFPSSGQQPNFGGSGAQQMAFPSAQQPNFGGSGAQQMAFPLGQQPNFGGSGVQQIADGGDSSFWSQNMATRESGKQQSMLPVPYQGQPNANQQALAFLPAGFPTLSPGIQQVNPLVPALPDSDQEAPVYVPPMYTKPRPIIPRYRAISGLISVIIVFSLLCGGSVYYAQVTGRLIGVEKFLGVYTPPSISSNQQTLPVPSNQVTQGPAWGAVVYSVGMSNRVDPKTGMVPTEINQFTVGETIEIACSAKPTKDGTLTVLWYSNGSVYRRVPTLLHAKGQQTATIPVVYGLPTEGKAEVYWNDKLAATVLFVVEPAA